MYMGENHLQETLCFLRGAIKFYKEPAKDVQVELMRVSSTFSVQVDDEFKAAMHRVTKKNPPRKIQTQLVFDVDNSTLGVKQLEDDPFGNYVSENDRGSVVSGEVVEVDAYGFTIGVKRAPAVRK